MSIEESLELEKMNRLHLEKKGLRGLAIAESFKQGDKLSRLAGVIFRRDFIVDGFAFGRCTIGGDDATNTILEMYSSLHRDDISFIIISGLIISMYNIVDIKKLNEITDLPVIGVTYKDSVGLEDALKRHFPDKYDKKIQEYCKLEKRTVVNLHTGYKLFLRTEGCTIDDSKKILDKFTLQGSMPEPLRVAQLLANSILKTF